MGTETEDETEARREAVLLQSLAENKFKSSNLKSAIKYARRAHRLCPSVDGLDGMVAALAILDAAARSPPEYYKILQVEPFAHVNAIKKQYKRLALALHPDKNPGSWSEEAFKVVGEAFQFLSDRVRRKEYDVGLRVRMQEAAVEGMGAAETFWTACSRCRLLHKFERKYLGHSLVCPSCRKSFKAVEVEGGEGGGEGSKSGVGREGLKGKVGGVRVGVKRKASSEGRTRDAKLKEKMGGGGVIKGGDRGGRSGEWGGGRIGVYVGGKKKVSGEDKMRDVKLKKKVGGGGEISNGDRGDGSDGWGAGRIGVYVGAKKKVSSQERMRMRADRSKGKVDGGGDIEGSDVDHTCGSGGWGAGRIGVYVGAKKKGSSEDRMRDVKLNKKAGGGGGEIEASNGDRDGGSGEWGGGRLRRRESRTRTNLITEVVKQPKKGDRTEEETMTLAEMQLAVNRKIVKGKMKLKEKEKEEEIEKEKKEEQVEKDDGGKKAEDDGEDRRKVSKKDNAFEVESTLGISKRSGVSAIEIRYSRRSRTSGIKRQSHSERRDGSEVEMQITVPKKRATLEHEKSRGSKSKDLKARDGSEVEMQITLPKRRANLEHEKSRGSKSRDLEARDGLEVEMQITVPKKRANLEHVKSRRSKSRDFGAMTVVDSDFFDFDKDRVERSFKKGQVWAVYDDIDGQPRHYGLVNEVICINPFEVRLSWLDVHYSMVQDLVGQEQLGFHLSCGRFKVAQETIVKTLNIFSHVVDCERAAREIYRIYPKKGSVWAVFKEGVLDAERRNLSNRDECCYDIVICLTTYSEVHGLSMAYLEKVDGFKTVFQRREIGLHAIRWLEKDGVDQFSHQIPAQRLSGSDMPDALKECWELDPASLPSHFLTTPSRRLQIMPCAS